MTAQAMPPRTSKEWNRLWSAKQKLRSLNHDASHWNARAKSFSSKDAPSTYADRFLALAAIRPGESVMDMGCGSGNLAVPLGAQGHQVLAADFSVNMLAALRERLDAQGICDVEPMELSWQDSWEDHGILPESRDVCIASRSVATNDLMDALEKLTAVARRRVCITLAVGSTPRQDDAMLRAIGIPVQPCFDSAYAIAILQGLGFAPDLTYIWTERQDAFPTYEAALEKYGAMTEAALAEFPASLSEAEALRRTEAWLEENLEQLAGKDGQAMLRLRHPRSVPWAFISWDKQ